MRSGTLSRRRETDTHLDFTQPEPWSDSSLRQPLYSAVSRTLQSEGSTTTTGDFSDGANRSACDDPTPPEDDDADADGVSMATFVFSVGAAFDDT